MSGVIVTYTTRRDAADANQALVEDVFAELAATRPDGIRYAAFRLGDGVGFVHAALLGPEPNPLPASPAFRAFQADLGARCEVPPLPVEATLIGSYRMLD